MTWDDEGIDIAGAKRERSAGWHPMMIPIAVPSNNLTTDEKEADSRLADGWQVCEAEKEFGSAGRRSGKLDLIHASPEKGDDDGTVPGCSFASWDIHPAPQT